MALVLKDRVKETTTTTGTGTYTLAGAVAGFEAFSEIGDGNTTYYACTDGTDFEVGIGTYTASGTTLARTTILQSSNSDNAVSWTSGTRTIFCTQPAEKAVFFDADGAISIPDGSSSTNNLTFGASEDLRIYHDGGASRIVDFGTGPLALQGSNVRILDANSSELMANFVHNGAVELYYDGTKKVETTADGVDIISTDAGNTIGPELHLYRNSASPADFDDLGGLVFTGNNSAGDRHEYALIRSEVADVTDGSEDAYIQFFTNVGGSSLEHMVLAFGGTTITGQLYLKGNAIHSNPHLKFEGSTANSFETSLYVTDPTADRTITLPDATGTVLLTDGDGSSLTGVDAATLDSLDSTSFLRNRGDGQLNGLTQNFQQDYTSGSYFTAGEYIEIASISPGGTSRNYNFSGKIMAQASNNAQILDINVGIRFNSSGSFGYSILYNSSQMNTDWVEPVLWINTTTDNIKLVIQAKSSSIHNLGVDLTFIQRSNYSDITWNTTEAQTDTTTVPTGYTEYIGEKAIGSVANGAVELYYNNVKKLETKSDGVDITGELQSDTLDVDGNADISGTLTMGDYVVIPNNSQYAAKDTGSSVKRILHLGADDNLYINQNDLANNVRITTNNTQRLQVTSGGDVQVLTGHLELGDDQEIRLGDSDDFKLFHKSSTNQSIINEGGAGSMLIQASNMFLQNNSGGATYAKFTDGGAAELYHNNAKTLETTSAGVTVTGDATVSGDLFVNGGTIRAEDGTLDFGDNSGDLWGQISFLNSEPSGFNSQFDNATRITNLSGSAEQDLYLLDSTAGSNGEIFGLATQANPIFAVTGNSAIKLLHPNGNTSYDYTIQPVSPSADRTIQLPDVTGTARVVQRLDVTDDRPVGWTTIAVLEGRDSSSAHNQRMMAKFTVAEVDSSRHVLFSFTAQHSFGQDNGIQVLGYSTYNTDSITAIRIKSGGVYGGAAVQVYVADATNQIYVYLDENNLDDTDNFGKVILKDGIADGTDPGNVGYSAGSDTYSGFTEKVQIDLQRIEPGGIAATGDIYTYSDIKFEGSTTDANETTLTVTTPTADRTITLPDATGQVVLSDGAIDTNASAEIGRAHIGHVGYSDYAGFSHVDSTTAGNYALLQQSNGRTFLNASSGQNINFNINNSDVMQMDAAGLFFFGGKTITFEGSTNDANETTLTVTDPTADRTITLPDATGTVVLQDSSGHIYLGDNEEIHLGDGSDFKLVHDGTNNIIRGVANPTYIQTDNTIFLTKNAASETMAKFIGDGAVELYYDNNLRLITTTDGVRVTGGTGDANLVIEADTDNVNENDNATLTLKQDGGNITGVFGLSGGNKTYIQVHDGYNFLVKDSAGETYLEAVADGAVNLYYDNVKKFETTADGVTITSTDDGAVDAPILTLFRDSASPADSDDLGQINFKGKNDAAQDVDYGLIVAEINDASDGTESGELQFVHIHNGSGVTPMQHKFGKVYINNGPLELAAGVDLRFEGATSNSNETRLTVADPTGDRVVTLPDATGTVLTTGNSDTPTTTTSSSDADFVLVDDGGTMKKITPANLGITAGAASTDDATALAIALG